MPDDDTVDDEERVFPDDADELEVEIGDLVSTADGRVVPVKWMGRQTVHKLFTPAERFVPVRVKAGALGNGLPHTDLLSV